MKKVIKVYVKSYWSGKITQEHIQSQLKYG